MSVVDTYKDYINQLNQWESIQQRLDPEKPTPFHLRVSREIRSIKKKLHLLDERDSGVYEEIDE